jgi:putative nucleotidyltransferase with HDIG domain
MISINRKRDIARFKPRGPGTVLSGTVVGVFLIALLIEVDGGLPSQLAHLYYLPVLISALLLPASRSVIVAVLAALAVSPAIDLLHQLFNQPIYFQEIAPWNLSSSGWILRPIAFVVISFVGGLTSEERIARLQERSRSESRAHELRALNRIDRMILSGANEGDSVLEISRFTLELLNAKQVGIATRSIEQPREQQFLGYIRRSDGQAVPVLEEHRPFGEGTSGWVMIHGGTSVTRDLYEDARYQKLIEIARMRNFRSVASTAIVLDGEILGALVVAHEDVHDFSADEVGAIERIADQAAVAISNARQRESLQNMGLETAMVLSNVIETRDAYTGDHCIRLVDYSEMTARTLQLPSKEIDLIKLGAALHDVGKIVIPDNILRKPDKLTPDEYAQIKQHCYIGGQICKKVPFLKSVYSIVYHHHEFYDGHGYPDGIAGETIPLGARIVSVADAYDAMTTDRPYRDALPDEEAIELLTRGAGSQWDPEIVKCFLDGIKGDFERLKAA